MKKILIAAAFVFSVAPLNAQSLCPTPCELNVGQSFTIVADHDGLNTEGYRVYIDGVKIGSDLLRSALVNGTITFATLTAPARGNHNVVIGAFNADGEAKSSPFVFTTKLVNPLPPTNLRIVVTATVASDGTIQFKISSVEEVK